MARGDGLKNYENLDLKDAKNDNRLTEVYRDWAKKYDYDMTTFLELFRNQKV